MLNPAGRVKVVELLPRTAVARVERYTTEARMVVDVDRGIRSLRDVEEEKRRIALQKKEGNKAPNSGGKCQGAQVTGGNARAGDAYRTIPVDPAGPC
jgi:hypothetical protein